MVVLTDITVRSLFDVTAEEVEAEDFAASDADMVNFADVVVALVDDFSALRDLVLTDDGRIDDLGHVLYRVMSSLRGYAPDV